MRRKQILGIGARRRRRQARRRMVRAGAGAAVLAAPVAAVPLVRRARRVSGQVGQAVDQTREAVGRVSDAAGTANKIGEAVSSPAQALGKIGGAVSGGGRGRRGGQTPKLSHLIEQHFDIAVPRSVVYNQWTQLEMFPTITKGVESVEQQGEDKARWTSKIGPSRRSWTGRIVEQVPDERIAWKSEGGVATEGVVSFHDVGDGITRVMLQMEYHPRGAFEWTANTLRVQRRRVKRDLRLFKHFLEMRGEETGAWRGRIQDGQLVEGDEAGRETGDETDDGGRNGNGGARRGRGHGRNGHGQHQAETRRSGGNGGRRSGQARDTHDDSDAEEASDDQGDKSHAAHGEGRRRHDERGDESSGTDEPRSRGDGEDSGKAASDAGDGA